MCAAENRIRERRGNPEALTEKSPLTAYVLAAILALLALEAMLLYRRKRLPLEA